ncbi:CaiB/BaiF CoA transferase family protein [Nocardioides soli]|uniref:Crotonobetainyl-CoA:carnitine CoA-transferase CaiB-like acyl-CoA transferase n=1 Tax=Nocardioides soli TaxID=1036020 RepID=A0A7W4VZ42_9ACTN|nr:CoA transferase [Nocardioides soli]MBB3044188.1 crotonobetainyl-CoA:carnitine CoA-transferase CaiB-like acyl-CoA transferase [Nocardioides soli]
MSAPNLPLAGIRVLDLSTVLAAPVSTTLLGDFGADVVKIEEPGRGDFTRGRAGQTGGRSPQWLQEGRNKRSVTINLREPEGQAILRDLIPRFDIIVTNYRPPTLERWGLGPDRLREIHPEGIFLIITGFGLTGPYRSRGSFDRIASAFAGLTYVSGDPDIDPVRSGFSVIDFMAAYLGAFSAMMALYHRDHHGGTGQVIDLALYEAGFRAAEDALIDHSVTGAVRERMGNKNPYIVPASDFTTADRRRVSLHAGTDALFARLASVMGTPELAADSRYASRATREEHQDDLYGLIEEWMARQTAESVVDELNDAGVPASLVMTIADISKDQHYRDRGTIVDLDDPEFGTVTTVAPLPFLSETPGRIRALGPELGEHTDEVLGDEIGLTAHQLDDLRSRGVV